VSAPPIPSAPADLELIAQLKSRLQYAQLRIRVLEERLRLMRIEKYGAGGEKLSQAQMQLFEPEPVVSEVIEQAEGEQAPAPRSTKTSCKHPGRQELPPNLPRVERDSALRAGSARVQHLAAILPGLADLPIKRLPSLTPSIWASSDRGNNFPKELRTSRLPKLKIVDFFSPLITRGINGGALARLQPISQIADASPTAPTTGGARHP